MDSMPLTGRTNMLKDVCDECRRKRLREDKHEVEGRTVAPQTRPASGEDEGYSSC
jgi:hypothetical protein